MAKPPSDGRWAFPSVTEMTYEQAQQVYQWRMIDEETWRGVASLACENWEPAAPCGAAGLDPANPICGEDLCVAAAIILDQEID